MEGALAQSASAWDADGFICWQQTQRQHCGAAAWSASLEVLCGGMGAWTLLCPTH